MMQTESLQRISLKHYLFRLDGFEGPLDLLLHLVRINEIDIRQVPLATITRQYNHYLHVMKDFSLPIASEFLVIAATLAHMKSQRLLPASDKTDEESEDPRQVLVQRLIEYQRYRQATQQFARQYAVRKRIWTSTEIVRETPRIGDDTHLDIGLLDLLGAFRNLLDSDPKKEVLEISIDQFSIEQKIKELRQRFEQPCELPFTALFHPKVALEELITTFLALLELIRIGFLHISQSLPFGEIRVARQ